MEEIDSASFEQLNSGLTRSIFDICGSKGNALIISPIFVNSPLRSNAPKYNNASNAHAKVSGS
ncbi:hypothetical protein A2U01_0056343, partial [Trifolium medium]|nr:hypothetical protein [Trifolium medium]